MSTLALWLVALPSSGQKEHLWCDIKKCFPNFSALSPTNVNHQLIFARYIHTSFQNKRPSPQETTLHMWLHSCYLEDFNIAIHNAFIFLLRLIHTCSNWLCIHTAGDIRGVNILVNLCSLARCSVYNFGIWDICSSQIKSHETKQNCTSFSSDSALFHRNVETQPDMWECNFSWPEYT